ncbi:hypothetical protein FGB62_284g01 [Gracilaria domingensis]|nr:hypothetical protein FGB62_284g01 [Gracilaria domingensis]
MRSPRFVTPRSTQPVPRQVDTFEPSPDKANDSYQKPNEQPEKETRPTQPSAAIDPQRNLLTLFKDSAPFSSQTPFEKPNEDKNSSQINFQTFCANINHNIEESTLIFTADILEVIEDSATTMVRNTQDQKDSLYVPSNNSTQTTDHGNIEPEVDLMHDSESEL